MTPSQMYLRVASFLYSASVSIVTIVLEAAAITVEIGRGKAIEVEFSIVTDVYNICLDVGVGYTGERGVHFPRVCCRNYCSHQCLKLL